MARVRSAGPVRTPGSGRKCGGSGAPYAVEPGVRFGSAILRTYVPQSRCRSSPGLQGAMAGGVVADRIDYLQACFARVVGVRHAVGHVRSRCGSVAAGRPLIRA
jgi:hypothetical protein